MAKNITRTITTTNVGYRTIIDGNFSAPKFLQVPGEYTKKEIMTELLDDSMDGVKIDWLTTEEKLYTISVQDFLKYAVPVEKEDK